MAAPKSPNPCPSLTEDTKIVTNVLSRLPEHIIYESLSRLPVKSLLRFKSVSKSWLSLISSRDFIKTHLSKSTNDPHFTHHYLILCDVPFFAHCYRRLIGIDFEDDLSFGTCSLYSLLNEPVTQAFVLDHPMKVIDRSTHVVGSCNGLICLACYDGHAFLWNPSTKKSRRLPKLFKLFEPVFGFCYDESNDDFKVFAIFGRRCYEYEVSVYSSKSDSWRMIGVFTYGVVMSQGKFANGAIHWVVDPNVQFGSQDSWIIISLDIKTETFQEVLRPKYGKGSYSLTLNTFGKSLSLLYYFENTCADFWVMKECDTEESWTKLFSIPYMDGVVSYSSLLKPLYISVNDDIILFDGSTIVLYNPKDNTFKNLLGTSFEELYGDTYVESLVSPHL